jgi:hypothetical protein
MRGYIKYLTKYIVCDILRLVIDILNIFISTLKTKINQYLGFHKAVRIKFYRKH